jgi:hypothetical protein
MFPFSRKVVKRKVFDKSTKKTAVKKDPRIACLLIRCLWRGDFLTKKAPFSGGFED